MKKETYDAVDDCISLLERTANYHFSVFEKKDEKWWNLLLSSRDKLKKKLNKEIRE